MIDFPVCLKIVQKLTAGISGAKQIQSDLLQLLASGADLESVDSVLQLSAFLERWVSFTDFIAACLNESCYL